ncbi:hypothetical protein C2G38_2039494 [Gigaspora rosea]|uniref:Uncharacterized protein n=1 Tax=Gigaspora rosea TaxID=44941 RepID=A0A397V114_9GLOM|nr:hypothetical protein C2G38_2039494 [Gigaspora rosea]
MGFSLTSKVFHFWVWSISCFVESWVWNLVLRQIFVGILVWVLALEGAWYVPKRSCLGVFNVVIKFGGFGKSGSNSFVGLYFTYRRGLFCSTTLDRDELGLVNRLEAGIFRKVKVTDRGTGGPNSAERLRIRSFNLEFSKGDWRIIPKPVIQKEESMNNFKEVRKVLICLNKKFSY